MSEQTLDGGVRGDLNRIRTAIASDLKIQGGIREKQLGACVTKVPTTKADKSKHLTIGSLEVDEVTDEKGDIAVGHYDVGAAYLTKSEYAKAVCFSGKQLRRAEVFPVERVGQRLREAMDHAWDKGVIEAACGNMLVGDECRMEVVAVGQKIPHDNSGITPEKITTAVRMLQEMNNGTARPIIPFTYAMQEQLTRFAQFTNNDFLLNGQESAYTGQLMKSSKWFGAMFKIVSDRRWDDVPKHTCQLKPTIKASPYTINGAVQPDEYIRYIPVWDANAIYWEAGYDPDVVFEEVWKQRRKPKGTSELRIDGEFGFARVDNCGVVLIEVVEKNTFLRLE